MSSIKPQSNDLLTLQKFILDPLSTVIKLAVLGKKILVVKFQSRIIKFIFKKMECFSCRLVH